MRLRIVHETAYQFDPPATGSIQSIRLTPRGHDGQFVINWRIEVDQDCRLEPVIDPFGNVVHSFNTEGPLEGLTITALGEIETHDMAGMVRGQSERFPVGIFLRDTALTNSDQEIRKAALSIGANAPADRLSKLHVLMGLLHDEFEIDGTDDDSAIATFAAKKGDSRALAHVFIAMARYLGIPARYASGYLFDPNRVEPVGQEYGWAEAFIDGVGWIGFDAALNLCPTDLYVRLAIGLDRIGAAPVRGTAYGTVAQASPLTKISIFQSRGTKR
jgi:transglutaminase-like putative cysteine protease